MTDTLEIDFDAAPYEHLSAVLDGRADPGTLIEHSEGAHLVRRDSRRNLWSPVVDGEAMLTFDGDKIASTRELGFWMDRAVEVARSDDRNEDTDVDPVPTGDADLGMH